MCESCPDAAKLEISHIGIYVTLVKMSLLHWHLDSSVAYGTEGRKKYLQMLQNRMEKLQMRKALNHLKNANGQSLVPDKLLCLTVDKSKSCLRQQGNPLTKQQEGMHFQDTYFFLLGARGKVSIRDG